MEQEGSGTDIESDVAVVGAGPAGLATSYELSRRKIDHVVLERGDQVGAVWANLYDSLTLHTGRHMSRLPGLKFPPGTPLFVPRDQFVSYLRRYAVQFRVPVRTRTEVTRLDRGDAKWFLTTTTGVVRARCVVLATGIVSKPRVPDIPGKSSFKGVLLHSSEYRRPADVAGDRVLVLGVGNSGSEIATELASAGRGVDLAVRSGAHVVPRDLLGIPVQYLSYWLRKLPRSVQARVVSTLQKIIERRRGPSPLPRPSFGALDAIPVIGFGLVEEIRAGRVRVRPGVAAFTPDGALFTDGEGGPYDAVVFATGYTPALSFCSHLLRLDSKGFAHRSDRVTSSDHPGLWFVGHNYDALGGLANIVRDASLVGNAVSAALSSDRAFSN
ncbi:NAD(P)/FAD-dependent oxidoreductase [Micromonospora sp. STR1s_5]|nr:NAD(P)/FAD-dependent oxidoreductase [Micromonospora sp. STR1s_5]